MTTSSPFTIAYVNGYESLAIGAALPAVAIIVVALRFWTRAMQKVDYGIDDWLILIGLVRAPCSPIRDFPGWRVPDVR